MSYVDGFVAALTTANKEAFLQHAQHVSAFFKECGVLQQVECWGDDVPQGKLTSQPMAVQCKPDETVVFSWLVWPSTEVREPITYISFLLKAASGKSACPSGMRCA